jgi:CRP-like cAMP-binding protein
MESGQLGKIYEDGDFVFRQGDPGECMYMIQEGVVVIVGRGGDREVVLARLGAGDFFGEMALVDREPRSAEARAEGRVRLLTVDRKMFLRKVHEDPSLAFRILEKMSGRIRELNRRVSALAGAAESDF